LRRFSALPLTAHAQLPAPAGEVVGVGNFGHIVADLDKSLAFYRDVIGLTVTVTQPFAANDAIMKMGATEGGQSRIAVLDVPGRSASSSSNTKTLREPCNGRVSTIQARRICNCACATSTPCSTKSPRSPAPRRSPVVASP
jgi:hypothetical protein